MFKKLILLFTTTVLILGLSSCEDDNRGYKEYYHPMGNNPVMVVPWLKSVRKSLYKNAARISLYELDEERYYTVQIFIPTDSLMVSPFTIYRADKEKEIICFHTDDVLLAEQDIDYTEFIENADLICTLWSNEKRYSTVE